jgi:hypothetical protein
VESEAPEPLNLYKKEENMVSKEDELYEEIKNGLIKLDAEKVKLAIDAGLKMEKRLRAHR